MEDVIILVMVAGVDIILLVVLLRDIITGNEIKIIEMMDQVKDPPGLMELKECVEVEPLHQDKV